MIRLAGIIAAVAVVLLCSGPVAAHPHVWVDFKIRVAFNEQGHVTALRQVWLFDEFYSAFVLAGAGMNGDGAANQEALDAVLAENISNLAEYSYFTRIMSGATRLVTGKAVDARTRQVESRIEMTFTLPLTEPVPVSDLPLRYAIFDPTYYIEMVHAEAADAVKLVDAPESCRAHIKQPNPDSEQVLIASSLDKTQSAGDGLGQYFAEEVDLTCG